MFKRLLRTARKTLIVVHLSPETSVVNQQKRSNIVLQANATTAVFDIRFCIIMLSNISVIRTVSEKTCLLDLSREWGFKGPGCRGFAAFLPGGGDFALSKNPRG